MSLNGLDNPEVQEAYQVAISEAAGWLLLKYAARDSVELLGRGKGGVHEARCAIAKYEEASPLYGLLIYRRRKVLIRYIPDGTSRVLQARTAVHFQHVIERYSPYETLLEITTSEALNDTSLAASFKLHTASPSASSNRLDEISEDAEDGAPISGSPGSQNAPTGGYFGGQRPRGERRVDQRIRPDRSPATSTDNSAGSLPRTSPLSSPVTSPKKAAVSQFLVRSDSGQQSITSLGTTTLASMTEYTDTEKAVKDTMSTASTMETPKEAPPLTKPLSVAPLGHTSQPSFSEKSEQRPSTSSIAETARPSALSELAAEQSTVTGRLSLSERSKYDDDPYDFSKFDIKPKVKLGPRPVAAAEKTKRPTVASIASVPANYRSTAKKQETSRPKSQAPVKVPVVPSTAGTKGFPTPPPIPDIPEYSPRPLSRGSVKSLPSHKSTAMTPDKIRLMKAVELRKKQLRKSNPHADTFVPPPDFEVPAVPKVPELPPNQEVEKIPEEVPKVEAVQQLDEQQAQSKKADSGIQMDYEKSDRLDEKRDPEDSQGEEFHEAPTEPLRTLVEESPSPVNGSTSNLEKFHSAPELPTPVLNPEPTMAQYMATEAGMPSASALDDKPAPDSPTIRPAANPPTTTLQPLEITPTVPTIVMADGSRPRSANIQESKSEESSPLESDTEAKSGYESTSSSLAIEIPEKSARRQNSDLARRRRGVVEPIHIDGDTEFMSDDELMEELQSATLQEAKPITVSKSPVAQFFSRRPSANSAASEVPADSLKAITIVQRSSSVPLEKFTDTSGQLSPDRIAELHTHSRSASTPLIEKSDPIAGMKRTVSSGISKRIQALAEMSNREGSPPNNVATRPLTPETSPNTFLQKNQNTARKSPPGSRPTSFKPISRHTARTSSYQGQAAAPNQVQSDNTHVWNVQHDQTTGRESVSVSARIVRPSAVETTDSATSDAELQQSELVISHNRAISLQTNVPHLYPLDTNQDPPEPKPESAPSRGGSPTLTRGSVDGARAIHSASKFGRSKASPTAEDFPPPPNHRTQIVPIAASNDENAAPKEGTRTSRFFKRMSIIGGKRKSGTQQSVGSSSPVSERGSIAAYNPNQVSKEKADMPPAVTVGDLNVQFPDSLLWKRRIVEIDDAGYLNFSIPQAMEHQKGVAKKFPFQQFKMPYVPDLDRQELPNSIMLDFGDGTTLQVACEDTLTHRQVVNVLKAYWRAWAGASAPGIN